MSGLHACALMCAYVCARVCVCMRVCTQAAVGFNVKYLPTDWSLIAFRGHFHLRLLRETVSATEDTPPTAAGRWAGQTTAVGGAVTHTHPKTMQNMRQPSRLFRPQICVIPKIHSLMLKCFQSCDLQSHTGLPHDSGEETRRSQKPPQ